MKEDTWASITQSYFDSAKDLALRVNEDPAGASPPVQGARVRTSFKKPKNGAESTYEAVVERTGEAYELIPRSFGCLVRLSRSSNNEAVSYIGGGRPPVSPAALAMTARPSRSLNDEYSGRNE